MVRLLGAGFTWLRGALLAVLGVLACSDFAGPPFGAVPMQPHAIYALWWEQVEACTGVSGALGDVDWYMIPLGRPLRSPDGKDAAGLYEREAHRITMAEEYRLRGNVIRHEMAHALTARSGHPRETFLGACEGVVDCPTSCVTAGGPPPEMGAEVPRIPPEDLEIAIAVEPATPSLQLLDGHFMLVITVTNPHAYDVVVTLPPSGDPGPPIAFSYSLFSIQGGSWYNGRIADAGTAFFTAGQTKRAVFDFRAGNAMDDDAVLPGLYEAKGGFSSRPYVAVTTIEILP